MLESFLIRPEVLTYDDVMDIPKLHFPCSAASGYPFVDLPPGNTLRCKPFPADKYTKSSYTHSA